MGHWWHVCPVCLADFVWADRESSTCGVLGGPGGPKRQKGVARGILFFGRVTPAAGSALRVPSQALASGVCSGFGRRQGSVR